MKTPRESECANWRAPLDIDSFVRDGATIRINWDFPSFSRRSASRSAAELLGAQAKILASDLAWII